MNDRQQMLTRRNGRLTASRIAPLMTGDEKRIYSLWLELTEDPRFVPEDLSENWAVQLGLTTEALNIRWFALKHGPVSRVGEFVEMGSLFGCTLDAWSDEYDCPIEAKHVGGYEHLDTIIDRYQPQMQWQMVCTGAEQCALSVIMGASAPIVEFVELDEDYVTEMFKRATHFMEVNVRQRIQPVPIPPIPSPVPAIKSYDMCGSNAWAINATTWLQNVEAKRIAVACEKELKALVPEDAKLCFGHGITITRDRAGRLSLKEGSND